MKDGRPVAVYPVVIVSAGDRRPPGDRRQSIEPSGLYDAVAVYVPASLPSTAGMVTDGFVGRPATS